jgi:hypothetical protein
MSLFCLLTGILFTVSILELEQGNLSDAWIGVCLLLLSLLLVGLAVPWELRLDSRGGHRPRATESNPGLSALEGLVQQALYMPLMLGLLVAMLEDAGHLRACFYSVAVPCAGCARRTQQAREGIQQGGVLFFRWS